MGRGDLAGAAHLQLVSGVVQLRPEDTMVEAMLAGWRAQQTARGLRDLATMAPRERLVRRFIAFTNEFPWNWGPSHMDEWTQSLTSEKHLAPSTIRNYQTDLRLFSEYLCDGRYGWAIACEREFGPGVHPVPICHEWNTIAHLNDYEGSPEARPLTREELQRFLDFADDQVERAVRAKRKGALAGRRGKLIVLIRGGLPGCGSTPMRWATPTRASSPWTGCCAARGRSRTRSCRRREPTCRPSSSAFLGRDAAPLH
jgi:hypothetical protein